MSTQSEPAQAAGPEVKPLTRPTTLDLVPSEVRLSGRFILHDENKIPLRADGSRAFLAPTPRSESWIGNEAAARTALGKVPHAAGVGYDLGAPIAGRDFDDCVEKVFDDNGVLIDLIIDPAVVEDLRDLGTYAEFSQSCFKPDEPRGGIKALFHTGKIPVEQRVKPQGLELYFVDRYFALTGAKVPGCPSELARVEPSALERCIKRHAGVVAAGKPKHCRKVCAGVDPIELLKKAGLVLRQNGQYLIYHNLGQSQPCLVKGEVHQGNGNPRNPRCSAFVWNPDTRELYHTCLAEGCRAQSGKKTETALERLGINPDEVFEQRSYIFGDEGARNRFVDRFGDDYLYNVDQKIWMLWDGTRFKTDKADTTIERLSEIREDIRREAAAVTDDAGYPQRLQKEAARLSGFQAKTSAIKHARSKLPVLNAELDCNPYLFNCANGTYDLARMKLLPHDRALKLSKCSPVSYDPRATCPVFDAFLTRILPDPKVRKFLQMGIGYTLSALTAIKIIFLLIGESGDNGKTTFIEIFRYLFGEDEYAVSLSFKALEPQHEGSNANTPGIARLEGARFVSACESEQGQRLSAAMLKRLAGGRDTITAMKKYENERTFQPTHKIFLATNYPPGLPANDQPLWNRIARVPFDVSIPKAEQDGELFDKMKLEGPGILNWALEGWRELRRCKMKLELPPAVKAATDSYRQSVDTIRDWFESRYTITNNSVTFRGDQILLADLHTDLVDWWTRERRRSQVPSSKALLTELERILGRESFKTNRGKCFTGIKRKSTSDIQDDLHDDSNPFAHSYN
ncbi:MAG TPA: phage/plasmid primase, P4 family [Terriglobales bacterium]|jgi:P4 family phage/plasmid primase-like protien|nr:phage/plasmid primase, P4 family [Terriglobales bacterium]